MRIVGQDFWFGFMAAWVLWSGFLDSRNWVLYSTVGMAVN